MCRFIINERELDELAGLPAFDFKLYCILRSQMDFTTGTVGRRRRISYQMLREEMYVEPIPGRHKSGAPTREQVRQSLKRLQRAGLLQPVDSALVFRMPCATTDQSAQNSSNTGTTREQHGNNNTGTTRKTTEKTNNCGESITSSNRAGTPPVHKSSNTPPVSGNKEISPNGDIKYIGPSPDGMDRCAAKSRPIEYPPEFEQAWKLYPKRAGSNPKRSAFMAWRARIRAGATAEDLEAGVMRYAAFCLATGKTGSQYVMRASTFFGPDEHYAHTWDPPPPPTERTNAVHSGFDSHGRPVKRPGESLADYTRRLGEWQMQRAEGGGGRIIDIDANGSVAAVGADDGDLRPQVDFDYGDVPF